MYPTSFIQEESQIHKDDLTDTLFIGMSNGESIILSGSYYFEVLKGSLDTEITELVYDSRKATEGCVFFYFCHHTPATGRRTGWCPLLFPDP